MLIDVWSRKLKPEMVEEALAFFKSGAAPSTQDNNSIEKQLVGVDRATNQLIMVTVWKSEQAFKALITSPQFQEFIAPLEKFYATPLEVYDYEMVYHL